MNKFQFLKVLPLIPPLPSTLLLHFDGTNGSTTFTDSSTFNRTISVHGNAQISTAQSKFNGASGYFDGTDDDIYGSYTNLALGAGDFTVDFWIYPTQAAQQAIFETRIMSGAPVQANSIGIQLLANRTINFRINNSTVFSTTATVSLDAWHHIALVRSGSTITLYIDGTSGGSATSALNFNVQGLTIGRFADAASGYYKGYYDELRMVVGTAVWTTNFTPPTSAYIT